MFAIRPTLWATVCTVAVLAVLLGLGTWQLDRLQWKRDLIAALDAARTAVPVDLPETLDDAAEDWDFRRVRVRGRLLHEKELYVGPRTDKGIAGVHIVTPLRRRTGAIVLINRGFVPGNRVDPATRTEGQFVGIVEVTGMLRRDFEPGSFTPENDPDGNQWYWYDLAAMSKTLGMPLFPAVINVDSGPAPGGLPRGGAARPALHNNHLAYAITWYGLALALVVIYLIYHRRGRQA